jgi:lysophospholipid acyltransferase
MLIDLSHARRTFIGLDGAGDITFAQSMMVQKLSLFAWNVYDGRRRTEASLSRRTRRSS